MKVTKISWQMNALVLDRHVTHQPEVIEVIKMKLFLMTTCIKKKVFQIQILAWAKLGRDRNYHGKIDFWLMFTYPMCHPWSFASVFICQHFLASVSFLTKFLMIPFHIGHICLCQKRLRDSYSKICCTEFQPQIHAGQMHVV